MILAFSLVVLSGCEKEEITPNKLKTGEALYEYYCKACHEKRGPGAYFERRASRQPLAIHKAMVTIQFGRDTFHDQPIFKKFTEKQITLLVDHINSFAHFTEQPDAQN